MEIEHTPETANDAPAPKGRNPRRWLAIAGASVLALGGLGAAAALNSGSAVANEWRMGGHHERGIGADGERGGMMHNAHMRGGMGFGPGRGVGRVLEEIDATDEQEDKLWEIFDGIQSEVRPLMREFRDTREDLTGLLSGATVDRAAIEALRAERVAAFDEASKKLATALADAAEVLTPEQRTELVEHFEDRGRRGRW